MPKMLDVVAAGSIAGIVALGASALYKPKPVIVQPQTTIISRAVAPGTSTVGAQPSEMTRAEKRQAEAQWGDLDQKEVDALAAALAKIGKTPLTIFCQDDAKCGDLALDFDNAFETARWETKMEAPLIDDTIGVATSREDLQKAINEATSGRLAVKIIAKNAPFDVLVIGKKGKGPAPGLLPTPPMLPMGKSGSFAPATRDQKS